MNGVVSAFITSLIALIEASLVIVDSSFLIK
jgi:hypothetical protein